MHIVNGDEGGVLIGNTGRALVELLTVGVSPPVGQVAVSRVLASLVVKAVGQFVANDHADAAKVHGIIDIFIKERRLQNTGGEVYIFFLAGFIMRSRLPAPVP